MLIVTYAASDWAAVRLASTTDDWPCDYLPKDSVMSTGEGSGSGSGTEFVTMRGRDYPSIRQFTVFLENRVGQLLDVVRRFEASHVRIVALTSSDYTEGALLS